MPDCLTLVSLYKSGRNQLIENYRAISLLACSKILEKVVTNQLLEYSRRNNYLTSRQFGYMQNVSVKLCTYKRNIHLFIYIVAFCYILK